MKFRLIKIRPLTVPFDPYVGPANDTKMRAPHPAACSILVTSSNVPGITVTLGFPETSSGSFCGVRTRRVNRCPCRNAAEQNSIPDGPENEDRVRSQRASV